MTLMLALPMKLPSVANQRIHWATKARQVKAQRTAVAWAMLAEKRALLDLHARLARGEDLRCVLMRCSPRKLDDDNLASAFKAIRDEVAKQLGVDDGGDRVEWVYRQNVATPVVMVTIAAVTQ